MSNSVLEQIRSHHVDVEQLEQRIVQHLIQASTPPPPSSSPSPSLLPSYSYPRLLHEHAAARLVVAWHSAMRRTLALYSDDAELMQQQMITVTADPWTTFYSTLSSLRLQQPLAPPLSGAAPPPPLPSFTAEEAFGRHVDLVPFHLRYNSLPCHAHVDYLTYLTLFSTFPLPTHTKLHPRHQRDYRLYVDDLLAYLEGFHARLRPLVALERLRSTIREEFSKEWDAKTVTGWFDEAKQRGEGSEEGKEKREERDERKERKEEQEEGKEEGKESPLYCRACHKLFAKATVFNAHLSGKKHLKATAELPPPPSSSPLARELAEAEYSAHHFALLLAPTVQATLTFTQHKLTLTPAELEAEVKSTQPSASDSALSASSSAPMTDDDDDAPSLHNPLHLPLGWDGKPIPFWLYKLNGLNQTFTCEICGGFTYAGPKVYREHFSQWRHAWGMKCIGIPNLKEFWHVTRMSEVKELWEKMRQQEAKTTWREDEEEEMEDTEGNVFNKKTFLELRRQGLI